MSRRPVKIEMRDQEQILLRADLKDQKTIAALKAAGVSTPEIRQRTASKTASAMWFSPDEALLFVPDAARAITKMKPKLPAKHLIHDATGARVVFTIKGNYLRDVLAKGTPQNMMAVEIGQVVRTHLGPFAVAFWFLDEKTVELVGFRSFARDLHAWLEMEARLDGLPVLEG